MTSFLPYKDIPEKGLAVLIADGDEAAFKELYRRVLPYLSGSGMKMLKSEDAVAEVLQESLIRLWVHRERLRDIHSPRAWVYRIFSNECFRYLKKYGLKVLPLEAVEEAFLPGAGGGPEQHFSMRETRHIIHDAVESGHCFPALWDHDLRVPEKRSPHDDDHDHTRHPDQPGVLSRDEDS